MAKRRTTIDTDTLDVIDGLKNKVKESREKERSKQPFTKPSSDYYRLDLVLRETIPGSKGHPIMTEEIKTDYRAYINSVRGNMSITKYIHSLIDQDMKRTHYKELLRDPQNK